MSQWYHFPFGLRFKLVMLSVFLFAIPWLGYEFVWEMEKYLRQGQEKTLLGTTRAVATALHERPKLFDSQASYLPSVKKGKDLYAYPIIRPIQLDGKLKDWRDYRQHAVLYKSHNTDTSLSFSHVVGKYGAYLYAYFEVTDDKVVYRHPNSLNVDLNDHLTLAFMTQDQEFQRYIISPFEQGWITSYRLPAENASKLAQTPEPKIQGTWRQTDKGYNVEIRIPLSMLGNQLGFTISDVDQSMSSATATLGTSSTSDKEKLGTILVPSPEIEQILKGLGHSQSRIWVVDQHQRVLASAGNIQDSEGIWSGPSTESSNESWWYQFEKNWLHPIYYKILTRPPEAFIDTLYDVAHLQGRHIQQALTGKAASNWRLTQDNKAVVLAAAYPIYIENQVMGAVIAEETTNGIRSLRNRALEKLFTVILAVMGLGTLALFIFASRISTRIRKLRDQAELAIDENGRIRQSFTPSGSKDEIGDLSRSFSDIVSRLGQYTHYLEKLSSRISHELRTPVAVVRSSLESLAMQQHHNPDDKKYMDRAQEGLNRLSLILTSMSEATRLEQSLQTTDKDKFDLGEVIKACLQGYEFAYPQQVFTQEITELPLDMMGVPEHIAQLLDKLIANAVEFADIDTPISVSLQLQGQDIILKVANQGPYLPEEMKERLFDSMVSVRPQGKQTQPHLGLGLHIALLITQFHQGSIKVENQTDVQGVMVTVKFPRA